MIGVNAPLMAWVRSPHRSALERTASDLVRSIVLGIVTVLLAPAFSWRLL